MTAITPIVYSDLDADKALQGYAYHTVILARDQHEYNVLEVAVVHKMTVPVISRWRLSPEELAIIMDGGDICLTIITGGGGHPPVNLQVVAQDKNPEVPVV